jgi:Ca-activated chloride channel family protein
MALTSRPNQPPQFRSGIELVEVDVSVLDKDRRPVRGLTKFDFMVLEDGRPQEIVSAVEVNVPDPVETPASWMRDIAPDVKANLASSDRLIVLVLDDAQVRMQPAMNQAVKEIGRRIIDRLGPADLASVVFTRDNRAAQPFTSDRSRLLKAVAQFRAGFGGSSGGGDPSVDYFFKSSLLTLKYVAESMAEADQRRKAVIYVSPGVPGAERKFKLELDAILREAQRTNVNIYSIDPSGLGGLDNEDRTFAGLPSDSFLTPQAAANDFLHTLASNTGGLAIVNRNEFSAGVTQIFRENGSYYLIGYRSSGDPTPGRYRRIDVRVYRPGLTVRARNGYYGKRTERPDNSGVTPTLRKALASVVPARDVAMQVTAAPFLVPGKRDATMALVLAVREPAPPPGEKATRTNVDVLVGAYGPDGKRFGSQRLTAAIQLRAESGATVQYEVLSEMRLRPGRYQLRFAAESSLYGKSGSVYYDVDVPDFSKNDFAVSGLVLSAVPSVAVAPRDAFAKLIPVVPTSRRNFWKTDQVVSFLRLYQGGKTIAPVKVDLQIRDANDRAVFEDSELIEGAEFMVMRRRSADHRVQLPMNELAPGPYLLIVEASAAGTSLRRDVRFVVQ